MIFMYEQLRALLLHTMLYIQIPHLPSSGVHFTCFPLRLLLTLCFHYLWLIAAIRERIASRYCVLQRGTGIHVAHELISFCFLSSFHPSGAFTLLYVTLLQARRVSVNDINPKQERKRNTIRIFYRKSRAWGKKAEFEQFFLLSRFISSVLPFWTPLVLVSLTLSLFLSLRFHHPADYRHQRNTNRLHTDVSARSSAGGVETR